MNFQVDYAFLARNIKNARKKRGLSQERLAENIEVSPTFISRIETGRSSPSLETVMKLCDALDVTPNELLLGSLTTSRDYLYPDIQDLFQELTPGQRRMIVNFIRLLIEENTHFN